MLESALKGCQALVLKGGSKIVFIWQCLISFQAGIRSSLHHHGVSAQAGHYTASLCGHQGHYTCDDHLVHLAVGSTAEQSATAYILAYIRIR